MLEIVSLYQLQHLQLSVIRVSSFEEFQIHKIVVVIIIMRTIIMVI